MSHSFKRTQGILSKLSAAKELLAELGNTGTTTTAVSHGCACAQGILSKLSAAKELLAELASREKKKMAEREAEKKATAEAEEKKKQTADAVPT